MINFNEITDVFFDLDHTLWDFDKNSALTFQKIFAINNVSVNLNDFLSYYEPINLQYWKLYREDRIDKASLRYGRLNDAFKAVNYSVSDGIIYKLSEDYIDYLTMFNYVFEDTHDILEYLNEKYELHIITNGFSEVQQGKLEKSRINHYFKTVTNSEMVGVKKPNPKIFNHALNTAKVSANKTIMIGDNYEADILGAKDVGMGVIHFNSTGSIENNGVTQINRLLELKQFL